jgi:hypothetical protein
MKVRNILHDFLDKNKHFENFDLKSTFNTDREGKEKRNILNTTGNSQNYKSNNKNFNTLRSSISGKFSISKEKNLNKAQMENSTKLNTKRPVYK